MSLKKSDIRAIVKNADATDEEKLSEILDLLHAEVDVIKGERDEYKQKLEDLTEDFKKSADDASNEWKSKYEKEHEAFEAFKANKAAKEAELAKEAAFSKLLKDLGISDKRIGSIIKLTDMKAIEMDEQGGIKDLEKVKEDAKNEWADFIPTVETQGASTTTPPATGNGAPTTKEEIMKIKDSAERQKAIAENPNLFTH